MGVWVTTGTSETYTKATSMTKEYNLLQGLLQQF
jgi:hypothetical protein